MEDNRSLDELLAALATEEVGGFGMQVSKNRWMLAALREKMERDRAALRERLKGQDAEKP